MDILRFDLSKAGMPFKIMNATNGGPWHRRHADDQFRSNFADYKAARIPYSRNHDSAVCGIYGGPYSHDVNCIFPNFDADPNDPASYDFACTDESLLVWNFDLLYVLGRDRELRKPPYRAILKTKPLAFRVKNLIKSAFPALHRYYRRKRGYNE